MLFLVQAWLTIVIGPPFSDHSRGDSYIGHSYIAEPRDLFEMVSKLYTVRGSQVEMFDRNQMISTS